MPRNGSGVYSLPASNPVVPFTVITSQWANDTMSDVAEALTGSIAANGTTQPSADLPMNGKIHTGVGPALLSNQYAQANQVQDQAFSVITNSHYDQPSNTYDGTLPFGAGGSKLLVHGTIAIFTPPATNATSAPKLTLNGGFAWPIVNPDGSAITAFKFSAAQPLALMWNSFTSQWNLVGSTGASVVNVTTTDAQVLDVTVPVSGTVQLDPKTNVANGTVKLTPANKVPVDLLPADALTLLGLWNAGPGVLPANGTVQGQYYVISNAGNLNLFTWTGAAYTSGVVAVVAGDKILWIQTALTGMPQGWYRIQNPNVTVAAAVTSVPTTTGGAAANVQAWMNAVDSPTGFATLDGNRLFTKMNSTYADAIWVSGNLTNDGVNWRYRNTGRQGWVSETYTLATYAKIDYITNAVGTAGNIATIAPVAFWGIPGSYCSVPWGVQGPPRLVGGSQQYHLDVYGPGTQRFTLQDTTNSVGFKVVAAVSGFFLDFTRMQADGTAAALPGVPVTVRGIDAANNSYNALVLNNTKQWQVGDAAVTTNPGSITSTHAASLGVYAGALDFRSFQTVTVSPGSNISTITLTKGQVARILVVGSGSITIPGAVKLPRGGAVYGTTGTLIGFYYDGTNIYSSFTPYD